MIDKKVNKCYLKAKDWHFGCCCNCKSHHNLYSHPWVDEHPISHKAGSACVVIIDRKMHILLSNEHGACELYDPVDRKKDPWIRKHERRKRNDTRK